MDSQSELSKYNQGDITVFAKYDPQNFKNESLAENIDDLGLLQRNNRRLAFLYSFGQNIGNIWELKDLFDYLLKELFEIFPATNRAIVFSSAGSEMKPQMFWQDGVPRDIQDITYSQTILSMAVNEKQGFIASDFSGSDQNISKSILMLNLQCTMIAPFLISDELLGLLQLDSTKKIDVYKEEDLKMLSGICNLISVKIKNRQLINKINTQAKNIKVSRDQLEEYSKTLENKINQQKEFERDLLKAKEEAEQATMAKSNFLATMSHEIRTPMNGVIGMTGLLLETPLTSEQKDFVETIRVSGEALLTIINDILDFSKIESGKMELEIHPFELTKCIEESFNLLSSIAVKTNLELLYFIDSNVPGYIDGDATRIRQILVNLIGNAIKFTSKGEVFVSVKQLGRDKNNIELEFCVKDTGIGISEENISKLFQPFTQAESFTTRKFGGTGLGLAICSRLVSMMNGKIWVESVPGKGSSFYFTVQASLSENIHSVNINRTIPEIKNKRVLIVDDNEANLKIVDLQCKKWGFKTHTTSEPLEAINLIKQGEPFDMAIVDMQMQEMNGLELTAKIREFHSNNSLPIIILTSVNVQESELKDYKGLFSAFLSKPIKQAEFLGIIMDVLSKISNKIKPQDEQIYKIDKHLSEKYKLKILIVEDNNTNQKLLASMLKHMGYIADIAGNGLEAIDSVERQHYDLIFMDVQMPEMDGLEATRIIVKKYPDRPKIIALTANAMQEDREICFQAGMDDYLSKPIKIEKVQSIIENWGTIIINESKQMEVMNQNKENGNGDSEEFMVFDKSVLGGLAQIMEEDERSYIIDIMGGFVETLDQRLIDLKKAGEAHNFKDIVEVSHAIKGACLNAGVNRVGRIASDIESKARENNTTGFSGLYTQLLEAAEEFKKEFSKFLSEEI
jgi:signal transduction histidine kinase/CheY-like chemotaxis protein/HPt (histidine-containing phosphotransfer) domain-containing protein